MGEPGDEYVDFFISYARADRRWAEWIAWQLEEAGYSVRLQAWDSAPASDFVDEMWQAVTSARRTIAVLSPEYLSSPSGQTGPRAVPAMDPGGARRPPVGVRVRPCQPDGPYAMRALIDIVDTTEDVAKTRLLLGLRGDGARPSRPPRFPGSGPGSIAELSRFPQELPEIWSVPYPHPSFIGRDDALASIRDGFAGAGGAIRCQVLAGIAGAGKTQLAVEYAHWRRADYDLVWWVRADDPATLVGDYTELGAEIGLGLKTDQDDAVAAVRSWLGHARRRWLLVLDGAADRHVLQRLVGRTGSGHVLITSRNDVDWHGVAKVITVGPLSAGDAVELLLARTGQSDRATAARLATALGNLPLALEQAGALIAQSGVITLADYLDLFERSSGVELLAKGPSNGGAQTVATTWDLSLEQLRGQSPAAVELLELAAFLAPEDLPWRLLLDHPGTLPPVLGRAAASLLEFGEVVVALRRFSLVKLAADGDGLIVHRLLRTVIRDRLDELARRHWLAVAVRLLALGFPSEPTEPSSWAACQRLLPHALQVVQDAERLDVEPEPRGLLLDRAVAYMMSRGQPMDAKAVTQLLRPLADAMARPRGPTAAVIRRCLGRLLRELGRPEEAREQLEQALAADLTDYGPHHEQVAADRYYLARVLRELGRLPEAQAELEQALAIDEVTFGPDGRRVAADRRRLGRVLHNLGDLPAARSQLERALAIDEAHYGAGHWVPAYDRCLLGTILRDLGEPQAARVALEAALEVDERTFGPNHWRVASDRRYLGTVLHALQRTDEARAQLEQAMEIDEIAYGGTDWRVALDLRYLGTVLHALGDNDRARASLEKALAIDLQTYGPDNWRVAQDHRQLGRVLAELGELAVARSHHERALAINQATYGEDDWRVAEDCRHYSATLLRESSGLDMARGLLERALAMDQLAFGPDHWRVAADRRYLAKALIRLHAFEEAASQLRLALAVTERLQGSHHLVAVIREDTLALRRELEAWRAGP